MAGVLILDSAYQPHRYAPLQEAVESIVKKKVYPFPGASIIAYYHSPSTTIAIPSIVVLKAYIAIPKKISRSFKKSIVFARDDYTCQYCGRHKKDFKKHELLTIDHVKPQSHFNSKEEANTYENVVSACSTCNTKKDNKLPYECGMYPIKTPVVPHGVLITIYKYSGLDKEQRDFIDMIQRGHKKH